MRYSKYLIRVVNGNINKCACKKCLNKKIKESNLLTYGVEYTMKVDKIAKKSQYALKTPINIVREKFIELNFTPLFTDEDYYNSKCDKSDSRKLKCICNKHLDIIQYKDYHGIMDGDGCKHCRDEYNSGENHWNWHGGTNSIIYYLRHCQEMKWWKYDSLKANDFSCYFTNERCVDLEIHHQKTPFGEIVKQVFSDLNIEYRHLVSEYNDDELTLLKKKLLQLHYRNGYGMPIKKELHVLFHKIYGFGNNDTEQFYQFYNTYGYGDLAMLTKDNYKELLVNFI